MRWQMNTLGDTDEGRARPSVWPVYLVAAVAGLVGLGLLFRGLALLVWTVGLISGGHYAAMLRLGSPWELPFFHLGVGVWGIIWALGLVRLRPWGWWCTAVFAAVCLAMFVQWLPHGRPIAWGASWLGLLALLVWVLASRRQLFFPPKQEGEEASIVSKNWKHWVLVVCVLAILGTGALSAFRGHLAKRKGMRTQCAGNLKCIALSLLTYAADHEGRFPPAATWPDDILGAGRHVCLFPCPADRRDQRHRVRAIAAAGKEHHNSIVGNEIQLSYTLSEACAGDGILRLTTVRPHDLGILFDGTAVSGGRETAAYRHSDGLNVGYADGRAQWVSKEDFAGVYLEP